MESKIHSQPMLPSDTGATQGKRISSRTTHLPRKFLCSAMASVLASTITSACETKAKRKVLISAPPRKSDRRKAGSCSARRKLVAPTQCAEVEEMVTSVKL